MTGRLIDLEAKVAQGGVFTREDAERVRASVDLIGIGVLGEAARVRRSGQEIRFGRVCEVSEASRPAAVGEAGEVRLTGAPSSVNDACRRVREARAWAGDTVLTGFSAADLVELCGHDHLALAACAAELRAAGLEAVAECPVDRLGELEMAVEIVRAIRQGGLAAWRITVDRAPLARRLDLADTVERLQQEVGGIRAYSPLPVHDSSEAPSTGYDDVRTVALASLVCRSIPWIQVAWPLHGPKLAQVALAYGANDIDGVAPLDERNLGPRRSPKEEIVRQIRAAGGVPVERDGRYGRRS